MLMYESKAIIESEVMQNNTKIFLIAGVIWFYNKIRQIFFLTEKYTYLNHLSMENRYWSIEFGKF